MASSLAYYSWYLSLFFAFSIVDIVNSDFPSRACEPIRIELCRGIGYNETSLPNIVGHEMQTEVEFVLQTFTPLIEYICSTQLKLFLCSAYVPMCTPKVTIPIGPCRSLCENVRSRCLPVLQGFGFPWPPALDCNRFPKENNHETMCMEGPEEDEISGSKMMVPISKVTSVHQIQECYGMAKSHLYIKLNRSGRCAPICDADILFNRREKNLAEMWVMTWSYAALAMALVATLCFILSDKKCDYTFGPLIWCNDMVAIGWAIRFMAGRDVTACGYDSQLPNVLLLLVDGLSNPSCAATFLLRYYFGMAACAWWSILCLDWNREVRQFNRNCSMNRQISGSFAQERNKINQTRGATLTRTTWKAQNNHSNFSIFIGWGIPAFQTAAVIAGHFVDADELIGSCYAGNQSEIGLQILVATPLFCYWIFGTMNLVSGLLGDRSNEDRQQMQFNSTVKFQQNGALSRVCPFLFIYSILSGILLTAVIFEFMNADIWLHSPLPTMEPVNTNKTPMWPFLTRALMELMFVVLTSAWVLGPIVSNIYKIRATTKCKQASNISTKSQTNYTTTSDSYQTIWQPHNNLTLMNHIPANNKYRYLGRYHMNETIL